MEKTFNLVANAVAHATGRTWAFALSLAPVVVWAATGPVFHYSEPQSLPSSWYPDPEYPESRCPLGPRQP